tara:strand:- start:813 stop:1649 length:837 start_codon:yes stop_codon:yes gene_type:complete
MIKHKLEFIKISPEHEFAGVGFAGNIFITLGALGYVNKEDRLYVDMETNETCCTQEGEFLHNTNNPWEYYFNQISINDTEGYNYMDSLVKAKRLHYTDMNSFLDPNSFIDLKEQFFSNFQIKDYIEKEIKNFYNENIKDKVTLGVQVRLTDYTHNGHNYPELEKYAIRINEILKNKPEIEQLFLATDDGKVIPKLKELVNVPIIFWDGMFRADEDNLHLTPYERFKDERHLHRYVMGIECMKEIFTLSKCDYLLKAWTSSMSIIATILSENIKEVYQL